MHSNTKRVCIDNVSASLLGVHDLFKWIGRKSKAISFDFPGVLGGFDANYIINLPASATQHAPLFFSALTKPLPRYARPGDIAMVFPDTPGTSSLWLQHP